MKKECELGRLNLGKSDIKMLKFLKSSDFDRKGALQSKFENKKH